MVKLYWAPRTRSSRPRWMLEELGVPYELVRVDMQKAEHKSPEHRKVHPLGAVPALVDGEVTMFESAAICAYLADKHAYQRLTPTLGTPARAAYEQWLFFAMATFEEPLVKMFLHTMLLPPEQRSARAADEARARAREVVKVLDDALADRPYLLGAEFSAADVVVGSLVSWSAFMGVLEGFPRVQEYLGRLVERPAFVASQAE